MTDLEMTNDARARQAGFSLIEALVAAVILLVIALGLIPLYTRSIRSNVEGFDSTQVSNWARSRAEEYLQLPFNSEELTLPVGEVELAVPESYSHVQHRWMTEAERQGIEGELMEPLYTRTTTVRQVGAWGVKNPLPGGTAPTSVHLKEITVVVDSNKTAVLGGGKRIAVRVFKSE